MISTYHSGNSNGTFLCLNAGNAGAFTGDFANFTIANVSKFKVDNTGLATSAAGVLVSGGTATGNAFSITSDTKTSGTKFNAYDSTSTYTGAVFQANMANGGGTFSGVFIDLKVAGTTKFSVATTGIPTIPALKSTTGTVFICADTNRGLIRSASACSGTI